MEEVIYPIPRATISEVLGLLEFLDDRGGRADIYRLASELSYELDDLLSVLKAGEMLGFLDTPGGDVVLLPEGKTLTKADVNQTKRILREALKRIPLFRQLIVHLQATSEPGWPRDEVLEILRVLLPHQNPEKIFATIVDWGRFAELFGYNSDEDRFYLDQT
ncbi:MAG: AAA-associated domain-containing protein [bacterium JZ-2024 1]